MWSVRLRMQKSLDRGMWNMLSGLWNVLVGGIWNIRLGMWDIFGLRCRTLVVGVGPGGGGGVDHSLGKI